MFVSFFFWMVTQSTDKYTDVVLGAEKALSYLKSASEQGYEVTGELYQAHRVLARFYHDKLVRRNDL